MAQKSKIAFSATSSMLQVIISGLTVFLLYRFLLEIIGSEKLGIWALVLSASSMVQAANLGMTGSIIKHIADYDALGDQGKIALAVQTSAISIAVASFFMVFALFPIATYYFHFTLDGDVNRQALEILPQALLAFWIYMVAGIYQSALYGCQLIVHRNVVLVADSVLYLVLCVMIAPRFGLVGLAWVRVGQNLITFFFTALLLKKHVPSVPIVPRKWNKDIFKEMFSYAMNFQLIAILAMLSDPVTKGFLGKFGTISMVAYYEMANKLVQLFRSILVNANRVLVPRFAQLKQIDEDEISNTYRQSYNAVFYFSVPGFSLLAVAAPFISSIWIGRYDAFFIGVVGMLSVGWLVNVLGVPAYHAGMGTGEMKENVIAQTTTTVINIVAILIIGRLWQGVGVIVAWSISLMFGGFLLNYLYYKRNSHAFGNAIPKPSRLLASLCLICVAMAYTLWFQLPELQVYFLSHVKVSDVLLRGIASVIMITGFCLVVVIPMWNHPMRSRVTSLFAGSRR